ncbi:unnamed protein product [Albugo candida]|uniref:Uncharacterized protein n=1 Tax=Albugo candida TaxID=65357 RepID=A0A024FZM0_9STRA|nr:unnamed protein product [Albugo candida]|eukprot:CCI39758.1 unnamed protein product [Albugo candida]
MQLIHAWASSKLLLGSSIISNKSTTACCGTAVWVEMSLVPSRTSSPNFCTFTLVKWQSLSLQLLDCISHTVIFKDARFSLEDIQSRIVQRLITAGYNLQILNKYDQLFVHLPSMTSKFFLCF